MVIFYCGINEQQWNHHPVVPGPFSCIAPVYGKSERTKVENRVKVPADTRVIQDSGAFSDGPTQRTSFADALHRMLSHSDKFGYTDQITHRASYDLLIDEVWTDGNRSKRRWSESAATAAVDETVNAAKYLKTYYARPAILSAQGVTARQYLECAERVIPLLDDQDILGLGGWCIIGKLPRIMLPVFKETVRLIIPYAAAHDVKRVHIWGVLYAPALVALVDAASVYGIEVSTDSAGPSLKPCLGDWGYDDWRDRRYQRPPVDIRGLERARHVQATRDWLARFDAIPRQLEMFR